MSPRGGLLRVASSRDGDCLKTEARVWNTNQSISPALSRCGLSEPVSSPFNGTAEQPGSARIGDALERAIDEWSYLPELACEWQTWDEDTRLHIAIDWPIQEDLLAQLAQWAKEKRLDTGQRRRYKELLTLVDTHRALADRLFGEY